MNKSVQFPPLAPETLIELQRLLRVRNTPVGLYRRYNLVWQLAGGRSLANASRVAGLHYTNAHKWLKRFLAAGLCGLATRPRPGRPRVYGKQPETIVIKTATSRPPDLKLGFTTWSLGKLERYLQQDGHLSGISRETIRRILRRHGLRFLTGQTWCQSNDPDFEVKKRHCRALPESTARRDGSLFR